MPETLKPCPFCGGVHIELICMGTGLDDPHVVQCDDCDASASGMSRDEAAAAWNRRAERTCRYVGDEISGGCSECRGWLDPACSYCPSCGARVVEP